jgi:hypothetical protein
MKFTFFHEPELEFGGGGTHIDIRYGIAKNGPLDIGEATAPTSLRVGFVGTDETIATLREWLEKCRDGVTAKQSKLGNLFPAFPGFSDASPFRSSLVFHDRWCSAIRQREIDGFLSHCQSPDAIREAAGLFVEHARGITENSGPMVILCVPPKDLLAAVDDPVADKPDVLDQELDEGSETARSAFRCSPAFRDVLKADAMSLGVPLQMVRPSTYTGQRARKNNRRSSSAPLQDEATRAWNLHTALYYKAGGVPWRLLRSSTDLATCFVGISFYKSLDGDKLLTSVAQVFNERGEGVIVKGAQAQLSKDDRQPHLSSENAQLLLKNAIEVYRKEHRTSPARLVVHKTSKMTDGEVEGFQAAADEQNIDVVELANVRRSLTRLFRAGSYPPLRGSFLKLADTTGLLYLRGSVQFFETYPGMYVPRPFEFSLARTETAVEQLAREILALSKLNWNNTQFDGGEPITVRAARRVGDILKCVVDGGVVQPSFRFYT